MNRWRQAAGNHLKDILYPHIGAGSFHYKIHLIEDYARTMNAKWGGGGGGRGFHSPSSHMSILL